MTAKEQKNLMKEYKPLVERIVNQQYMSLTNRQKELFNKDEIRGYALEGMAKALISYDKDKSNMTFRQYLAFAMRNNCLTGINEESRTIKISFYNQKKRKEDGKTNILTTSIDNFIRDEDNVEYDRFGFLCDNTRDSIKPINILVNFVRSNFDSRISDIFLSYYGLDNKENEKGIEIAKRYGISNASVTLKIKKVIKKIKDNEELMETLRDLI